jgi:hypothetical protein
LLGGDEVEGDRILWSIALGSSNKEVLSFWGLDHHGVGWPINVGVVLVEPRFAQHNLQTFHGYDIERGMKIKSTYANTCIVQDMSACDVIPIGKLDGKKMRKWGRILLERIDNALRNEIA